MQYVEQTQWTHIVNNDDVDENDKEKFKNIFIAVLLRLYIET